MSEVTRLLDAARAGAPNAADQLLSLVYNELRRIAAHKMAAQAHGHTLQPTALVHEAWVRLGAGENIAWQNRAHFFGAAAEAMRRILVENARRKLSLKRGGDQERVELVESNIEAPDGDEHLVQVHQAVDVLSAEDPQKAEVVKLRFFVGLSNAEIADLLDVNERTVRRHWEVAKVRLFQLIKSER